MWMAETNMENFVLFVSAESPIRFSMSVPGPYRRHVYMGVNEKVVSH